MGKKGKGGKTEAKAVKQAAKPSQKEKDRQSKEEKAAQRLAVRKEKNLRRRGVSIGATTTDTELAEEQMKTVQEESLAKKAAARAQMLEDLAKRQKSDMIRASIAKSKIQREKDLEEELVARAAMKARAAVLAEDALKRKNEESSRHYFPQSPLRSEGIVDPETASPIKKKYKNDEALSTVIEIDMELEEKEDSEEKEDQPPLDAAVQEADANEPTFVSPPEPQSILRKKKSMLEAAASGVEPNVNPFFAPKTPGSNKEGIPPSEFANEVFIEPTITIPPKPKDFVGTDTKWAISQITDWFKQAQTDLAPEHSLILLTYLMTSKLEPEAMKNTKKYLQGTINSVKKYIHQFRVNTQAAGKGNSYSIYTKMRIGTNAFGEDLDQLLMDLKSVSSNVAVYKSTLQKANTNVINWILNSHRSFDVTWLTNYVEAVCVRLHAGTCNQSLPGLDKTVFEDREKISLGFQWRPVYDGKNKEQRVEAGLDQTYAIHVICEKKDKSLARALMNSLLDSRGFARTVSLEFRLAPCFQMDNGPAERLKLLESLANHTHVQKKIMSATIPDLVSLDIRAPPLAEQVESAADDSATAMAEKRNPTARQLLMRLEKKGMPGVKIFTDVSLNFNKTDYIATLPEVWKDEGRFVAANAAAFLYRRFGEVGLSFFPDYVRKQVKAQGWNEAEDRPVTAGEEELNRALRPYAKDSAMTKMFDFSKMENTPLKQDLQNPGQRPARNLTGTDSPVNPQKLAYQDALSMADQSAYYNANGTPREPSGRENVTFGEDTTMGSGLQDDDLSIKSDEAEAVTVLNDNETTEESSVVSNKTSISKRSAGSIARSKHYANAREQFNNEIGRVKDRHTQEIAELRKQMEILKTNLATVGPTPPEVQETPPPNDLTNQANGDADDPTSESDEEEVYVDEELEAEIKEAETWMRRNGIPIPPGSTTEETVPTPPADPPNHADIGAAESPHTGC